MKKDISKFEFMEEFRGCDRDNQFSYDALNALYDYLEEYDPEYELDVIALCCDFSEDLFEDAIEVERDENGDIDVEKAVNDLSERTVVIWHDDEAVLYQNY